ncbi:hypothetical protein C7A07_03520 [Pseudomonas fragi]|nr:hypothetical protein C7A07_03520 [Pseudomonas fragi]
MKLWRSCIRRSSTDLRLWERACPRWPRRGESFTPRWPNREQARSHKVLTGAQFDRPAQVLAPAQQKPQFHHHE